MRHAAAKGNEAGKRRSFKRKADTSIHVQNEHKQRLVPDALRKEIMTVQELGAQFSRAISWVGAQLAESRAHKTRTVSLRNGAREAGRVQSAGFISRTSFLV